MRQGLHKAAPACFLLFGVVGNSQEIPCPADPLDGVEVTVTATVGFNSTTQRYTYTYVVNNVGTKNVERFFVRVKPPVEITTSPQGWHGSFLQGATPDSPGDISWGPVLVDDTQPEGMFKLLNPIRPGESKTFALESPNASGAVPFSVAGDEKVDNPFLPSLPPGASEDEIYAAEEEAAETLIDQCPQLFGHYSQRTAQSVTKGPTLRKLVTIDIKPGVAPPNPVDPNAQGFIAVAIYSKTDPFYDPVASVDAQSVRFGRNFVKAVWSNKTTDINGDGIADLLFLFPNRAAGFRCFDKAEFLYGKDTTGGFIIGYDSIAPVCP